MTIVMMKKTKRGGDLADGNFVAEFIECNKGWFARCNDDYAALSAPFPGFDAHVEYPPCVACLDIEDLGVIFRYTRQSGERTVLQTTISPARCSPVHQTKFPLTNAPYHRGRATPKTQHAGSPYECSSPDNMLRIDECYCIEFASMNNESLLLEPRTPPPMATSISRTIGILAQVLANHRVYQHANDPFIRTPRRKLHYKYHPSCPTPRSCTQGYHHHYAHPQATS